MSVTFDDLHHPLNISGTSVIVEKYLEMEDSLSFADEAFLVERAVLDHSTVGKNEHVSVFLYNRYAFQGPYINKTRSTYSESLVQDIRRLNDITALETSTVVRPLCIVKTSSGSHYITFPNIYYGMKLKVYSQVIDKLDMLVIVRSGVVSISTLIEREDLLEKISVNFTSLLTDLVKLYIAGANNVVFDNILVDMSTFKIYIVNIYTVYRQGFIAGDREDDRYFYINRRNSADYIPIWSSTTTDAVKFWNRLVDGAIDTVRRSISAAVVGSHSARKMRAIQQIDSIIAESQYEESHGVSLFEMLSHNVRVTSPSEVLYEARKEIGRSNPRAVISTKAAVKQRSAESITSQYLAMQKAVHVEPSEAQVPKENIYAEIWRATDVRSAEQLEEVVPRPLHVPEGVKRISSPKFTELFPDISSDRPIYGPKGGMRIIGRKQDKTYSSGFPRLNTVKYPASELYTVAQMSAVLQVYIQRGKREKAFMAATELWRMIEINAPDGPKELFNRLAIIALEDIGPANNDLVLITMGETRNWLALLEKHGEKLDKFVSLSQVFSLVDRLAKSEKSNIVKHVMLAYTDLIDHARKDVSNAYMLEDQQNLSDYLNLNYRDIVGHALTFFKQNDDDVMVQLGVIIYVLIVIKDMGVVVWIEEYLRQSKSVTIEGEVIKGRVIKRGTLKNPIYMLTDTMFENIYHTTDIKFFTQFCVSLPSHALLALTYLAVNYSVNEKLGAYAPISPNVNTNVDVNSYALGKYQFVLDDYAIERSESAITKLSNENEELNMVYYVIALNS